MNDATNLDRSGSRSRLLATASTLALIISVSGYEPALAAEPNPTLWFELGWSIENIHDSVSELSLPLGTLMPPSGLTAPLVDSVHLARTSSGDGKITFQPEDSTWSFSLSVRYGRSAGSRKFDQALAPLPSSSFQTYKFTYPLYPQSNKSREKPLKVKQEKLSGDTSTSGSHVILDFQAGKDVGIGLFGRDSTSVLSAGARFANFAMSRHATNFHETRGIHFESSHFMTTVWPGYGTRAREIWDAVSASGSTAQRFSGLGPSIQWDASAELWSDPQGGGVSLEWGANAALLFGKQKKNTKHHATTAGRCYGANCSAQPHLASNVVSHTDKNITVPNVGGFAGISLNYSDVQIRLGYRADLFMKAFDVGVDTRKSSDLLFHGPYASFSIGVGD